MPYDAIDRTTIQDWFVDKYKIADKLEFYSGIVTREAWLVFLDIPLPFSYIQRSPGPVPITKRRIGNDGSFEREP
jgi:hypothetical protein